MSTTTTTEKNNHFQDHLMEHHHEENFFTKYLFTMDHKMIGKQFLITGMIMGIIGVMMSMLFRLEIAYPEQSFPILEFFLGKWAPDGVMDPNIYLALVTIHGTIMVFFVLTAGLSGTFSNLLIPLQLPRREGRAVWDPRGPGRASRSRRGRALSPETASRPVSGPPSPGGR
jgi:cytochrome c oxidase subunit 1